MYEVASFKNFENNLTTVKVMMKTKVAPFYLGHGVYRTQIKSRDNGLLVMMKGAATDEFYRT